MCIALALILLSRIFLGEKKNTESWVLCSQYFKKVYFCQLCISRENEVSFSFYQDTQKACFIPFAFGTHSSHLDLNPFPRKRVSSSPIYLRTHYAFPKKNETSRESSTISHTKKERLICISTPFSKAQKMPSVYYFVKAKGDVFKLYTIGEKTRREGFN